MRCFLLSSEGLFELVVQDYFIDLQVDENTGTLEAGENDAYVDPESWTADGPVDQPIMGQQHSKKKDKRQSGASSQRSSVIAANHNNHVVPPVNNYNENISSKQPTITSVKDKEMDDLPHNPIQKKEWTTYVPTTDGSNYVPSETSSEVSSVTTSKIEEDADIKRLSHWSQSAAPRTAAPIPVIVEEKKPVLPPKAHKVK